jgi:hypothetical protein
VSLGQPRLSENVQFQPCRASSLCLAYPAPTGMTFLDLLSHADRGDTRATAARNTMVDCLGHGMRMTVAGVAPEKIFISGDLTRSWNRFGPAIQTEVRAQMLPGGPAPLVIAAPKDGMTRLRGAVALVLKKHFSSPAAPSGLVWGDRPTTRCRYEKGARGIAVRRHVLTKKRLGESVSLAEP